MEISINKAKKSNITEIIKVHVKTWKSAYEGIVPDNYIQSFIIKTKDKKWQKELENLIEENIFFVAKNNKNEIVGFAIGGLERNNNPNYKGELMGIYILKEYQRQGIGKELTRKVVGELIKIKINSMLLWVLENNPFHAFYKTIGGKIIHKKEHENLKLPVVAYGYDNLTELIKKISD